MMDITFLGTGTSHGIPMIGCECPVCLSTNPKNKRKRSSLRIKNGHSCIIIDLSPDLRTQALEYGIRDVQAVLITHPHADHIFGFDDLRLYGQRQRQSIPIFGSPETVRYMQEVFRYALDKPRYGTTTPRVDFRPVEDTFQVGGTTVTPLDVEHGSCRTYGYLITCENKRLGYFPDCKQMPEKTIRALHNLDVMILDGLRHTPHPTHLSLEESLGLLKRIDAGQSYITHLCHDLEHEETQKSLPDGCFVPYDGLVVSI